MKRKLKIVALTAAAGVIFQLGGCAAVLAEQVITGALGFVIRALVDGLLGDGSSTEVEA